MLITHSSLADRMMESTTFIMHYYIKLFQFDAHELIDKLFLFRKPWVCRHC